MLKYLLTLLAGGALCCGGLEITRDGAPVAAVYVAQNASEAEKNSATELVRYLQAISGATLPVVNALPSGQPRILIGRDQAVRDLLPGVDFDRLREDEIIVASPDADTLILTGAAPRGTLYAVYSLLEELGVRFWSPDHEFVPAIASIQLPALNFRYAPPFGFRQGASETTQQHRVWSAKQKLNGALWQPSIPAEFGGDRTMDMRHSLVRDYVKAEPFFAEHPEWYAWRIDENKRTPTQLCTTNDEAMQQLVREIRADLTQHPEWEFVSVSFEDNDKFCECAACAALVLAQGSPAALSATAANYVAREIAADFPQVTVSLMAYWKTERPPATLRLEPNVIVVFAMLDRNHGLPPSATARHDSYLKKWSDLSGGNVYIWDYYATFGNFLLPMPNLYVMGDAFRTYRDFGVKGVFSQLPYGTLAEFVELRSWLFGQLTWNPDRDARALVSEYLAGHYGAAAPFLQQYIDRLETARDRNPGTWIGVYSEETKHWLTAEDILDCRALFDQALAATAADPAARRRVDGLRASILMTTILRYDEVKAAAAVRGLPLPERAAMIDDLEALGREFQCNTYKEWDDFFNLIKRLRETAPTPVPTAMLNPAEQLLTPAEWVGVGWQTVDGVAHLPSRQLETGFQFQNPACGEIAYVLPPELAGRWQVAVTLRIVGGDDAVSDGASLGIYAPNEITRLAVAPQGGAWQTVSLGTHQLPPDSRIWVMFGVTGAVAAIEVKSITLTPA